jgi:hypothetical protein
MHKAAKDQAGTVASFMQSGLRLMPYEPPAVTVLGNVHELVAMAKSQQQDVDMCVPGPDPVCD